MAKNRRKGITRINQKEKSLKEGKCGLLTLSICAKVDLFPRFLRILFVFFYTRVHVLISKIDFSLLMSSIGQVSKVR